MLFICLRSLKQRSVFDVYNSVGMKLLSRLQLQCSIYTNINFAMISKMLLALYMIVALILKQQTTFFTVNRFLQKIYKKLLLDLFKIDVALKNLNDELLLDVLLFGSDKDKDTVNKEILIHAINFLKTVNALKDHCLVVGTTL